MIDQRYPAYGLFFRRYAPFARFGRANPLTMGFGYFEGDDRGVSTSLHVSSRTYGAVFFNKFGPIFNFAGTDGTHFHPAIGSVIVGSANVKKTFVRSTIFGPFLFGFHTSTAAGNPLVPKSPDIDTILDVKVDFGQPNTLRISGTVCGDNFPNLEVFLVCSRSAKTALLVDGQTEAGRNTGPLLHLFGEGADNQIASFQASLLLDQNELLDHSSTVGPTSM